jgi:phosphonate transport system substrate-binding protein
MLIKSLTAAIVSSVALCVLAGACSAEMSRKNIIIEILPCSDVVMSFKKFHPLMKYLRQQTGFEIETAVPKDFEEFEWALKNSDIDFAFQDPHTYVKLAALYNSDALIKALTRNGNTYQYGLIIAGKGSGIKTVRDLKGKTVMFGPKFSAAKWIAAKDVLHRRGISIETDLRAYLHGGCCEDIAFNVCLNAVDAGAVCDHFLEEHSGKLKDLGINVNQIRVIEKTGAVPTRVFAARKKLDPGVVAKINRALLRLDKNNPAHAEILYPAELGGFIKATDADYDSMRILMRGRP